MQQRNCKPDARVDSVDSPQVHSRLGMARSFAGGAAPQGADTANSIPQPSPGAGAAVRAAFASAEHGHLYTGDGAARGECHGADLGAGRPVTQTRVDSSGPG